MDVTRTYPSVTGDTTALRPVGIAEAYRRLRDAGDQQLALALDAMSLRLRRTAVGSLLHERHFKSLEITAVDAPMPDPRLAGLRVAFLSDLHAGPFMDRHDLLQVFARVAAAKPDLVCLGGDLVSARRHEIELYDEALSALAPPLGVYAVLGNHEYHDETPYDIAGYLAARGVEVLHNRGRRLELNGTTLWLAGIDDHNIGQPDLAAALRHRRAGESTLLLSHNPDVFPAAAERGVDLTLAGHTHGGQIRLFGWAPITNSRHSYRDGHYTIDRSRLFVGRGAGTAAVPLRVGAPPEIPVVRLIAA